MEHWWPKQGRSQFESGRGTGGLGRTEPGKGWREEREAGVMELEINLKCKKLHQIVLRKPKQ